MATDILINEDNDLRIENGDFVVGESDTQHKRLLITETKGSRKAFPKSGVGIISFLKDEDDGSLVGVIANGLRADGATGVTASITNDGKIKAGGKYS